MAVLQPVSVSKDFSIDLHRSSSKSPTIFGFQRKSGRYEKTHFRLLTPSQGSVGLTLKASREYPGVTQGPGTSNLMDKVETKKGDELFEDLKHRFQSFKRQNYMENIEHFQNLSKAQAPKFMVVACADSRVCPSNILGFQPGESFTIRNVANLVPPFEKGPWETNAALEFAVNSLKVENILVIGHSCCGGIRALMSMPDVHDELDSSSFISSWVVIGKNARLSTKSAASNLDFDQQCRHCEKESVNKSLLNLLTYPWIEEKVKKGVLSIHGGYYDFVNCTFEKWTVDYKATSFVEETPKLGVIDKQFWS